MLRINSGLINEVTWSLPVLKIAVSFPESCEGKKAGILAIF